MKKIISIVVLLFLISSCGTQKSGFKLKTYNAEDFTVNYPSTWVKYGALGYTHFTPKEFRKENPENELNHLSVKNLTFKLNGYNDLEKILNNYGKTVVKHEKNKDFKLIKLKDNASFIYKLESIVKYTLNNFTFKRVEFFYKTKGNLEYLKFQMREDLFDKYINEAMIIINSFHPKK